MPQWSRFGKRDFAEYRQRISDWTAEPGRRGWLVMVKIVVSVLLASAVAYFPEYAGLEPPGRVALFILLLSIGLWLTEAMPAYAVGLLVIGLEIATLGRPGGLADAGPDDWEKYGATFGSPIIWLFFSGFVIAAAAERTGLTVWLTERILNRVGERPWWLLAGMMGITFTFSMFISNTAAAAMMVVVAMPIVNRLAGGDPFRRSLMLGIAIAANLGGMGTIIGSPPNAIAAGALKGVDTVGFAEWMLAAIPPAVCMLVIAWGYLCLRYEAWVERIDYSRWAKNADIDSRKHWQRLLILVTLAGTVVLWVTEALHGIPATVIAFIPVCIFTTAGILTSQDIRGLRWDVLLLIAGGLSLGLAVTETGLASWLVGLLPFGKLQLIIVTLILAYLALTLSTVISNTVAANVLVPISIAAATGLAAGVEAQVVVPLAMAASAGMAFPISTPPNSIVYGTEEVGSREFLEAGLLVGAIAPLLIAFWCQWVLG